MKKTKEFIFEERTVLIAGAQLNIYPNSVSIIHDSLSNNTLFDFDFSETFIIL